MTKDRERRGAHSPEEEHRDDIYTEDALARASAPARSPTRASRAVRQDGLTRGLHHAGYRWRATATLA